MNRYSCSLDKLSKVITFSLIGFCAFLFATGYIGFLASGKAMPALIGPLFGAFIILVLVIGMYYIMPTALAVDSEGIMIERKAGAVFIRYSEIKSIKMASGDDMRGTVRVFGNGGLSGYTGMFYNRRLGTMTFYCTRQSNYIIIDKNDGKCIVISPDDPVALVSDIKLRNPSLLVS